MIPFTGHNRQIEFARLVAMLDPALGPSNRPVLVLSCISHSGIERIPCVYMAHELQLNLIGHPWMVPLFVFKHLPFILPLHHEIDGWGKGSISPYMSQYRMYM